MANQNVNDTENQTNNKRLAQDDAEKQNASNKKIAGIAFVLVLIAVVAYVYLGNNTPVPDATVPVANTVQQAPATQLPATAPVNATTNSNSTDMVNQPTNNGGVNSATTPAP